MEVRLLLQMKEQVAVRDDLPKPPPPPLAGCLALTRTLGWYVPLPLLSSQNFNAFIIPRSLLIERVSAFFWKGLGTILTLQLL